MMTSKADGLVKWVEISRSALLHNLGEFRRILGKGPALMAVIKSNAYGHGLLEVASIAIEAGANWLGVNEIDEGLALRDAGHLVPVLVMGMVPIARIDEAIQNGLRCVIYDLERAKAFSEAASRAERVANLHIKVETGLHRQGIEPEKLLDLAQFIHDSPWLELDGLSTHFANIEDTTDQTFAQIQLGRFRESLTKLERADLRPAIAHCACTAAAMVVPETTFDMVRVGVGMYGLWPSKETQLSVYMRSSEPRIALHPVMTWKTRIAQVKKAPRGTPIGYGCTEVATHNATIAVLPVGYYDGYDRGLSNQGQVLIRNERAYVRGRVCMNMMMVDVSHLDNVRVGEEVVLLGGHEKEHLAAEFIASQLGTINYEVVTRVGSHMPRMVVS